MPFGEMPFEREAVQGEAVQLRALARDLAVAGPSSWRQGRSRRARSWTWSLSSGCRRREFLGHVLWSESMVSGLAPERELASATQVH